MRMRDPSTTTKLDDIIGQKILQITFSGRNHMLVLSHLIPTIKGFCISFMNREKYLCISQLLNLD